MQKEKTKLQNMRMEVFKKYQDLPFKEKINLIAQTFECKTGKIIFTQCRGKWANTNDMSIRFNNGVYLFIGNCPTSRIKSTKIQTEFVNRALMRYNPENVQLTKEIAMPELLMREANDNWIAVQKGLKPYTLLTIEFNKGSEKENKNYIGWYYVTLAVDGKICTHLETGLYYEISEGKISYPSKHSEYFIAGGLKETEIDYVFNNVGHSSTSSIYSLPLRDDVLKRAERAYRTRIIG